MNETNSSLNELKVDDCVIVKSVYGEYLSKVERITDKQVVVENGIKFWKKNGEAVGANSFHMKYIFIPSEDDITKLLEKSHKEKVIKSLKNILDKISPVDIPTKLLNKIKDVYFELKDLK